MKTKVLGALLLAGAWLPSMATAAPALNCKAKNDTWTVTGSVGRRASCSVTCLFTSPTSSADRVTCSFTTAGGETSQPYCEGSQLGRVWTSAMTLSQQCAYGD